MLNLDDITDKKQQIMKILYDEKIDFRTLVALRDKLFESPN